MIVPINIHGIRGMLNWNYLPQPLHIIRLSFIFYLATMISFLLPVRFGDELHDHTKHCDSNCKARKTNEGHCEHASSHREAWNASYGDLQCCFLSTALCTGASNFLSEVACGETKTKLLFLNLEQGCTEEVFSKNPCPWIMLNTACSTIVLQAVFKRRNKRTSRDRPCFFSLKRLNLWTRPL